MFGRRLLPVLKKFPNKAVAKSPSCASNGPSNDRFTMLTYNMLSPHYMWPQVYTYVQEKYKNWGYRHQLLETELFYKYKADIICLQELTGTDYNEFWKDQMKNRINYGSNFAIKPPPTYWTKSEKDMDGVGIFYNLEKFTYLFSNQIYLNDLVGTFDQQELNYLHNQNITLTNGAGDVIGQDNVYNVSKARNQVCLFVLLRHKETKSIIVVINTHLYWKYDEVKLVQCLTIMRKLQRIIKGLLMGLDDVTYSNVKILFCGDFNSARDSLVIKFLNGEMINHGDINLQNPMRAYLSHSIYDEIPDDSYIHTCYSGKLKGIFDYIWFHQGDFEVVKVLSGAEVSKELDSLQQFGLPNENHPSDHIPVLTELRIL
ncbi:RNA exonuclease NGL1 [Kluyveromyces marxianus]